MDDGRARRWRLFVLGAGSLVLFWAPLVAPLIQGWTLLDAALALRGGAADRRSAAFALGAAVAGLALFLATEYLWVV